jgi:hypothetical protein
VPVWTGIDRLKPVLRLNSSLGVAGMTESLALRFASHKRRLATCIGFALVLDRRGRSLPRRYLARRTSAEKGGVLSQARGKKGRAIKVAVSRSARQPMLPTSPYHLTFNEAMTAPTL